MTVLLSRILHVADDAGKGALGIKIPILEEVYISSHTAQRVMSLLVQHPSVIYTTIVCLFTLAIIELFFTFIRCRFSSKDGKIDLKLLAQTLCPEDQIREVRWFF